MEQTVEQKLKALYELQTIHTKIDKIRQVRGEDCLWKRCRP